MATGKTAPPALLHSFGAIAECYRQLSMRLRLARRSIGQAHKRTRIKTQMDDSLSNRPERLSHFFRVLFFLPRLLTRARSFYA